MSFSKQLCSILKETKNVQNVFYDFMSSYFRNLLPGRMGEDTIPFFLLTDESTYFETIGFYYIEKNRKCFSTTYFRIEEIHESQESMTVSLLLPLDIDGNIAESIYELYRLERTRSCLTMKLEKFCGIQFIDPRFVNRKWPIVEPKW